MPLPVKAVVFDAYGTLYDIQSVASATEAAYPGNGEIITQIWRMKQLEYTWLRSLMARYEDFAIVTRDSLTYTLQVLGLPRDGTKFAKLMDKYLHLELYPDALPTLNKLNGYKRAILSNGSPDMLNALVKNTGLAPLLDATISVDSRKTYKPSTSVYNVIEEKIGVALKDVLFVSSNSWDAAGAKSAGLNVAWIERVKADALATELQSGGKLTPLAMFKALRMRPDELDHRPDYIIHGLADLVGIAAA
jgi:2-haloacid dehalogenase